MKRFSMHPVQRMVLSTDDARIAKAAELLDIDFNTLRAALTTNFDRPLYLYCFELGRVKQIKHCFGIGAFNDCSKHDIVLSTGFTRDIEAVKTEHARCVYNCPSPILKHLVVIETEQQTEAHMALDDFYNRPFCTRALEMSISGSHMAAIPEQYISFATLFYTSASRYSGQLEYIESLLKVKMKMKRAWTV